MKKQPKNEKVPGNVFTKRQLQLIHQQMMDLLARDGRRTNLEIRKMTKEFVTLLQLTAIQDTIFAGAREAM